MALSKRVGTLFNLKKTLIKRHFNAFLPQQHEAIAKYGSFLVVLAGGSTPKSVYQLLAQARRIGQNGMCIIMMTVVYLLTMQSATAKWRVTRG
jgi:hypothetical protein